MMLPGVTEAMLEPDFWIRRLRQSDEAHHMDRATCSDILWSDCRDLVHVPSIAATFLTNLDLDVFHRWLTLPEIDGRTLYNEHSQPLNETFWQTVTTNASFGKEQMYVRFGFAVRRADVRRWPTATCAFRTPEDREFDQFQETALHTFEPVIVLADSRDGQWHYAISQTYAGWGRSADIAIATWQDFLQYAQPERFVVVTRPGVCTQANPYDEAVSKRWIEMAAYLPIADAAEPSVGNQIRVGHTPILYPVRLPDGTLEVRTALISNRAGIHEGYLPFSPAWAIRSAFQLLTERYGWGDSFGNHDCSSLVMDVFRTMGVPLPRNAGAQEHASRHRVEIPPSAGVRERMRLLEGLGPGVPLYMPGHTMLYLGCVDHRHYVIHDFAGFLDDERGDEIFVPVNEVMVSTLDVKSSKGQTYLESLTGVLELFPSAVR